MRTLLLPRDESRVNRWLWRFTVTTLVLHSILFCWSIYRRLWQVQRIKVIAPSTVLAPSTEVGYDVITSGEVQNLIRLELVRGDQRETLLEQRADRNRISAYDPRWFHYKPTIALSPELLSRFREGPAMLRLTVFGGQKLLHTPPPRTRQLQVQVVASP